MSAKFKRHYEARLESIADYVKVWFVVYVYGVQSWREVWQCDSKEEAERLAAQRNALMHAAKTKGLKLKPCPFCGGKNIDIDVYDEGHCVCERRHGHCYNCGTLGPTIYRDKCRSDADNIRKAVASWNRRAGEKAK